MSKSLTGGAFSVVCDIGGTNIRFAKALPDGTAHGVQRYPVNQFENFADAFAEFQSEVLKGDRPHAMAVGAAGPVRHGVVHMTNANWTIRKQDLETLTEAGAGLLVNDLQAIARSIPVLETTELLPLIGTPVVADALNVALAVNVGTGFGAAALHRLPMAVDMGAAMPRWLATATEAGHVRDAGAIVKPGGRPRTFEDDLSGRALQRHANGGSGKAEDLFSGLNAAEPGDPFTVFSERLGGAVCDLILALGAWDGVYLVGSVACAWAEAAKNDAASLEAFRRTLQRAGKMQGEVCGVPVCAIRNADPALLGLAHLLRDHQT